MIAKKSSKADLERKRFAFFQIGLIVAGSLTLAAFEYSSVHTETKKVAIQDDGPSTIIFDPSLYEDQVEERPEPQHSQQQQAPVVMIPIDEVSIVTKPVDPNLKYTGQTIFVTDPCTDCIGTATIIEEDEPLWVSEVDPEFPGGFKAMYEFISSNVKYPDLAAEMGAQGTVQVHFIVNRDGSISDVTTDSRMNKDLEKEAMRVISMMPNWKPGEQAGKPVRVHYTVPINFIIQK
ncbi:MAG: energy transducer TonB [Bacteroidetes bacterium]|nr:energy transducer TonB [Bacteroidota bacterium]